MVQEIYLDGTYLKMDPTWGQWSSSWKASQISRMITRNQLELETVCEVGCGAGEVLRQLQSKMNADCTFYGYDVSPQAIELCKGKENERLHFKLGDITREKHAFFDLVMVIDVLEIVDDYLGLLREIRSKGDYKIFHIHLNMTVQRLFRQFTLVQLIQEGHVHFFSKATALQTLKYAGYEILDYCYTGKAVDLPTNRMSRQLMKLPRRLAYAIHKDLAVSLFGGWELLVLAR